MKALLLLLVLNIGTVAYAQNTGKLKGTISSEGEALELASVVLLRTSFGASTNKGGTFEINDIPAGKYQLRISFVGYENFQTEVSISENETTEVSAVLISLTA